MYEIGSVTQTFVAAALALYARENPKFNIDAKVQPYFDRHYPGEVTLPVYTDPSSGKIYEMTFADLVSMHSGFGSASPKIPPKQQFRYTLPDFFAWLSDTVLVHQPGTAPAQLDCNTNYAILALILQKMMDVPNMAALKQKVIMD